MDTIIQISKADLEEVIRAEVKEALHAVLMQESNPDQMLTQEQARKLLGISRVTLWQWCKNGEIPYYQISRRILFKKSELMATLKKGKPK